jgi:hypothetical protein
VVQQDHHHPPKEGGLHKFRRWREIDKNAFEMVEKKEEEEAKVERETLNKSLRDPIKNTNTKDPLNCTHTQKKKRKKQLFVRLSIGSIGVSHERRRGIVV